MWFTNNLTENDKFLEEEVLSQMEGCEYGIIIVIVSLFSRRATSIWMSTNSVHGHPHSPWVCEYLETQDNNALLLCIFEIVLSFSYVDCHHFFSVPIARTSVIAL